MGKLIKFFVAAFVLSTVISGIGLQTAVAKPVSAILELFSSQGCSSCPPADALLHEYVARDDILAISLPVDYWDNLGWKDTLGSPANSQRQRDYARHRGDRSVYTPQIVVNGLTHVAGYDRRAIDRAITATGTFLRDDKVDMTLEAKEDMLVVSVAESAAAANHKSGTIWLLLYSKSEKVSIKAGENSGRTVTYANVVREMTPIGLWHGDNYQITLPKSEVMSRGFEGCAVMLQAGMAGPILAAAMLDSW